MPRKTICKCIRCSGAIQFDDARAGECVDCPHCGEETVLFRHEDPDLAASSRGDGGGGGNGLLLVISAAALVAALVCGMFWVVDEPWFQAWLPGVPRTTMLIVGLILVSVLAWLLFTGIIVPFLLCVRLRRLNEEIEVLRRRLDR